MGAAFASFFVPKSVAGKVQSRPSKVWRDMTVERDAQNSTSSASLWQSTPRRSAVIFLFAVFFVFTSFGFVGDIANLGSQSPLRFAVSVLLTGLFAVGYAVAGIALRRKSWLVIVPLFVIQFAVMSLVARWLPDSAGALHGIANEMARLRERMIFDGNGIVIGVSLGYAGFVIVFISEGRRHIKAHREMAVLEGEMAAAREVQDVILPGNSETFPGFRVESVYRPASQVGGDFFQVISAGNGSLLIVVGDVAGKGLPAAMLVSMLVGSIRSVAEESYDPVHMLQKLQDRLMGRTRGGFCTALAAYIASDGLVTIANAGHLSPYLDGREMSLEGAFPLGIVGSVQYEATNFRLEAGSRLTFISDGVVEATDSRGELFGFDRAKAISGASAAEIAQAAVAFGQSDDITVVTVERLAA
jgi:sigma-B regulation protein RsbU (phosphoserine phosphatase)